MEGEGAGRKFITIDWNKIDELLVAGCRGPGIAAHFGCHPDTLYDRCVSEKKMSWTDYSATMRAKGDSMLEDAQFKNAMNGNCSMQIWLGKQRLGQREEPKSENEFNGDLRDFMKEFRVYLGEKREDKTKQENDQEVVRDSGD